MFKKILSLALALMLIMSVAVIAASATQVEIAEDAADVPAEVGAEAPEETGAGNLIYFDTNSTGWGNFDKIAFHIWAIDDDGFVGFDWGSKKQDGTDEGNGVWSYDLDKIGTVQSGHQYCVIFYSKLSGSAVMQTYNLLFGAECVGQTASCDGTVYENPEDSNKTAQAAFWGGGIDSSVYGPELKITSIGNVVGTCCAASTTPYKMFVGFLNDTLGNARQFSGKDDQTLLDDTAKALGIGQSDIEAAIAETGVSVEWKKADSKADATSAPDAGGSGNTKTDDSSKTEETKSGSSGSGTSGSGTSGSSSTKTGSGSTSKTGQETTVLFIMLGVMVAAAGVIFFVRKKERA